MQTLSQRAYQSLKEDGLLTFAAKATRKMQHVISILPGVDYICYLISKHRLQQFMDIELDASDCVDTAYSFEGVGLYKSIQPIHGKRNAGLLLNEVRSRNPQTIVEIGAGLGGSFYLWSRAVPTAEVVVSLDVDFKTGRLLQSVESNAETHLLERDSHQDQTKEELKEVLGGRGIDFLYIDGDHSYEGVIEDFEMYSPLVNDGGVIIFDDVDNTTSAPEVPVAWREIKDGRESKIIKESEKSSAQGIIEK